MPWRAWVGFLGSKIGDDPTIPYQYKEYHALPYPTILYHTLHTGSLKRTLPKVDLCLFFVRLRLLVGRAWFPLLLGHLDKGMGKNSSDLNHSTQRLFSFHDNIKEETYEE